MPACGERGETPGVRIAKTLIVLGKEVRQATGGWRGVGGGGRGGGLEITGVDRRNDTFKLDPHIGISHQSPDIATQYGNVWLQITALEFVWQTARQ